jgi:hypothetical protein
VSTVPDSPLLRYHDVFALWGKVLVAGNLPRQVAFVLLSHDAAWGSTDGSHDESGGMGLLHFTEKELEVITPCFITILDALAASEDVKVAPAIQAMLTELEGYLFACVGIRLDVIVPPRNSLDVSFLSATWGGRRVLWLLTRWGMLGP